MNKPEKQYPEGHFIGMWIGIGIAICTGFGLPLAIATGHNGLMAIGPAIGVSIGVAIGSSIEAKRKEEGLIRPLTDKEKKDRKVLIYGLVAFFLLAFIVLIVIFIKSS